MRARAIQAGPAKTSTHVCMFWLSQPSVLLATDASDGQANVGKSIARLLGGDDAAPRWFWLSDKLQTGTRSSVGPTPAPLYLHSDDQPLRMADARLCFHGPLKARWLPEQRPDLTYCAVPRCGVYLARAAGDDFFLYSLTCWTLRTFDFLLHIVVATAS